MPLQRVSSEEGARQILRRMIEAGRCTLEDLDLPAPGFDGNPDNFCNLLRDGEPQERVEAEPSPRDFMPAPPTPDPFDF